VPLYPRPPWPHLPDPPGTDPKLRNEFERLADGHMDPVEAGADEVLAECAALTENRVAAEGQVELLGADLAAGLEELGDMAADANADTLEPELVMADEQDAVIVTVSDELAEALGEEPPPAEVPPPTPTPEPAPAPAPPPPGEAPPPEWEPPRRYPL